MATNTIEPNEGMAPLTQEGATAFESAMGDSVEQGQEALWIEEEHSVISPNSSSTGSPGRSTARVFFKKPTTGAENAASKRKMFRRKKVTQGHSILLEHSVNVRKSQDEEKPDLTVASTESSDVDPQIRALAGKISAARVLLDQALACEGEDPEALAQSAFSEAVAARLASDCDTNQVTGLPVYQKQRAKGESAAIEAISSAQANNKSVPEPVAEKVRGFLSEILPPVPDTESALCLDGLSNGAHVADVSNVMSMSSLNEILDGSEDDKSPEKSTEKSAEKSKKKSLKKLFGKKAEKAAMAGAAVAAAATAGVVATGASESEVDCKPASSADRKKIILQRFEPKVVSKEDGGDDKNIKEVDGKSMTVEELENIKEIDASTAEALKEALLNDDTESLSSYDGVKLFGGAKKNKKKKADGESMIPLPTCAPRDISKEAPTFISVPPGRADILTQKSWESLVDRDAVDPMDAPNSRSPTRRTRSESSASSQSEADKYTVQDLESSPRNSNTSDGSDAEDKYSVMGEPEGKNVKASGGCAATLCGVAPACADAVVCSEQTKERPAPIVSRGSPPALADELTNASEAAEEDAKNAKSKRKMFGGIFKRKKNAAKKTEKSAFNEPPPSAKSASNGTGDDAELPEVRMVKSESDAVNETGSPSNKFDSSETEDLSSGNEAEADAAPVPEPESSDPICLPINLTREQTIEKTAIETAWREMSPQKLKKAASPATTKDPLIARLRGKRESSKKTRRAVDP